MRPILALTVQELIDLVVKWGTVLFVLFAFLIAPILRAIRDTAAQRKKLLERRSQGELNEQDAAARSAWEALERGEAPPRASVEVPPLPPMRERLELPPDEVPEILTRQPSLERAADERSLEAPSTELSFDEERLALEENQRRLREERARREELLVRERAVPQRGALAARAPLGSFELQSMAETGLRAVGSEHARIAHSRQGLRDAVIWSEILRRPIALRAPDDASGPAGFGS
jgi:hypothetical protein